MRIAARSKLQRDPQRPRPPVLRPAPTSEGQGPPRLRMIAISADEYPIWTSAAKKRKARARMYTATAFLSSVYGRMLGQCHHGSGAALLKCARALAECSRPETGVCTRNDTEVPGTLSSALTTCERVNYLRLTLLWRCPHVTVDYLRGRLPRCASRSGVYNSFEKSVSGVFGEPLRWHAAQQCRQ